MFDDSIFTQRRCIRILELNSTEISLLHEIIKSDNLDKDIPLSLLFNLNAKNDKMQWLFRMYLDFSNHPYIKEILATVALNSDKQTACNVYHLMSQPDFFKNKNWFLYINTLAHTNYATHLYFFKWLDNLDSCSQKKVISLCQIIVQLKDIEDIHLLDRYINDSKVSINEIYKRIKKDTYSSIFPSALQVNNLFVMTRYEEELSNEDKKEKQYDLNGLSPEGRRLIEVIIKRGGNTEAKGLSRKVKKIEKERDNDKN